MNTYVDSSVLLAALFAEDQKPSPSFWDQTLYSSKLVRYECYSRIHVRPAKLRSYKTAEYYLDRIHQLPLSPKVLKRSLNPYPKEVKTLDSLHLATLDFLKRSLGEVRLATYDQQMAQAAKALGFKLAKL